MRRSTEKPINTSHENCKRLILKHLSMERIRPEEIRGTIEKAQQIAAHESPRTTKLYDRTQDQLTLDEIERILI